MMILCFVYPSLNKWISDLINPYFVGLESLVLDSCVCVDLEYFLFVNSYGISIEKNACMAIFLTMMHAIVEM